MFVSLHNKNCYRENLTSYSDSMCKNAYKIIILKIISKENYYL